MNPTSMGESASGAPASPTEFGQRQEAGHGRGGRAARRLLAVLRGSVSVGAIALIAGLMVWIHRDLRNTIWCYYTDDAAIREEATGADVRLIQWEDPYPAFAGFNVATNLQEPAFTIDDARVVFTRGLPPATNADLFVSAWDGRQFGDPQPMPGVNTAANETGAAFSRDGSYQYLYFASDRPGGLGGFDLWAARWDGARWSAATNLGPTVNSAADELSPFVSPDGRHLFFASARPAAPADRAGLPDRRGGRPAGTGFDIFRAVRMEAPPRAADGTPATNAVAPASEPRFPAYGDVERVAALCSAGNDLHPVMTPRGDFLYFASDRPGGLGGFDLYCSRVIRGVIEPPRNLGMELNSARDETAPAIRMEGFDLLFCSNREEADPARFRLYTSTTREVVAAWDLTRWHRLMAMLSRIKWWLVLLVAAVLILIYLLKHYRDLTSLFHRCLVASIILHLLALLGMAFWFISTEVIESMSRATMEVAIDVNALAKEKLALDMQETVTELAPTERTVVVEPVKEPIQAPQFTPPATLKLPPVVQRSSTSFMTEVVPSSEQERRDADVMPRTKPLPAMQAPPIRLPKLEVRLETREPVEPPSEQQPRTEAQETPVDVVEFQQPVKIRRAESVKGPAAPIERVVAASEVKQAPTNVVPTRVATAVMASAGRETADPVTEIKAARNLAAVMAATAGEFTPLRMKRPSALQVASVSGEAEGTNEAVEVASLQQGLPVGQRTVGRPATRPVGSAAQPSDIETEGLPGTAGARNTGGKAVVLTAGVEGPGQMPELHGVGESAVLLAKYPGRGARFRMNAPGKLDVPSSFGDTISSQLFRAPGKLSPEVVEALGGSGETQAAIGRALDWFSKNQEPDGRWDIEKHAGERGHDMAATALTLLCFYGWGAKHTEEGGHNEAVRKALNWLLSQMKDDGALYSGQAPRNNWMYDHGMATIALCEAYGLSKDPALLGPAKRAVQFIIDAQNPQTHGWRYLPRQDADTSVFGWHYMALRSARLAGIDVPEEVFLKANKWLDRVGGGQHGGIYGYQGPDASRPAMIATGMFCRQLAGVRRTDPKMQEGALYMRGHPILAEPMNYYYLYYGTLALYQHQGEIWEDWNKRMKEILLSLQDKTGADAGSWPAVRDWHGERMGRVVTTAMATLSLEVYYRLLPLYGFHFLAETPEDGAAAGKPTDATAKEPAER